MFSLIIRKLNMIYCSSAFHLLRIASSRYFYFYWNFSILVHSAKLHSLSFNSAFGKYAEMFYCHQVCNSFITTCFMKSIPNAMILKPKYYYPVKSF